MKLLIIAAMVSVSFAVNCDDANFDLGTMYELRMDNTNAAAATCVSNTFKAAVAGVAYTAAQLKTAGGGKASGTTVTTWVKCKSPAVGSAITTSCSGAAGSATQSKLSGCSAAPAAKPDCAANGGFATTKAGMTAWIACAASPANKAGAQSRMCQAGGTTWNAASPAGCTAATWFATPCALPTCGKGGAAQEFWCGTAAGAKTTMGTCVPAAAKATDWKACPKDATASCVEKQCSSADLWTRAAAQGVAYSADNCPPATAVKYDIGASKGGLTCTAGCSKSRIAASKSAAALCATNADVTATWMKSSSGGGGGGGGGDGGSASTLSTFTALVAILAYLW